MKFPCTVFTTFLAAGCLSASLVVAEPTVELIMSVEEVRLEVDHSDAQGLIVVATGTTSTGGWVQPKLRPKSYDTTPADKVLDVEFVATRPAGNAIQVLSPVSASLTVPVDSWVRGVRVHSRTNTVESRFGG